MEGIPGGGGWSDDVLALIVCAPGLGRKIGGPRCPNWVSRAALYIVSKMEGFYAFEIQGRRQQEGRIGQR